MKLKVNDFNKVLEIIKEIRKVKSDNKVAKEIEVLLEANDYDTAFLATQQHLIEGLAGCKVKFLI